ncbi:hypothetical protein GO730_08210 [Spirosoma sp. HMF3257]|uniref:M50 family metallopeptidase n=1 Tax=Spirosoma telluris TaxID=2183553 RepID=A0A327NG06_9BACT|nr:hypothetical protein [Spirosoma telluris]RAI74290.1 hypothetical protein HMF3257_08120 [Spirosoma telluris]
MKKKHILQMLLAMLAGASLGYGGVRLMQNAIPMAVLKNMLHAGSGWEETAKVAGIFVSMWAALLVHELGHLLTGLALHFRFHILVVGRWAFAETPTLIVCNGI